MEVRDYERDSSEVPETVNHSALTVTSRPIRIS